MSPVNKYYALLCGFSQTPLPDAKALLAYVLKEDPLLVWRDTTAEEHEKMLALIEKRKNGVPVAYLTGEKEFMALPFYVNESTLIPRPDTEIVVETLIELYKNKSPEILDVCTGSGCIGISLLHYLPSARATLLDISDGALRVAEKNVLRHGLASRAKLVKSDILKNPIDGAYDLIVSNPPYIESDVCKKLEVYRHEPHIALDGGEDGLKFYRAIIPRAHKALRNGGTLAFEIGYNEAPAVKALMEEHFKNVTIKKDYGDNDRMVFAAKI